MNTSEVRGPRSDVGERKKEDGIRKKNGTAECACYFEEGPGERPTSQSLVGRSTNRPVGLAHELHETVVQAETQIADRHLIAVGLGEIDH